MLSRKKLQFDLDLWTSKLQQTSCLGNVRHLEIEGTLPLEKDEKGCLHETPQERTTRLWENNSGVSGVGDDRPAQVTFDEDGAWKPLANFIQRLPSLTDIYYSSSNQFLPCLLEALHQYRPQCRLHLYSFKLRSIYDSDDDYCEFALVKSPCLYSISTRDHNDEHFREAVYGTVFRLAPNLRHCLSGISVCMLPMKTNV